MGPIPRLSEAISPIQTKLVTRRLQDRLKFLVVAAMRKSALIFYEIILAIIQLVCLLILPWPTLVLYLLLAIFSLARAKSVLDHATIANKRMNAYRMDIREKRLRTPFRMPNRGCP